MKHKIQANSLAMHKICSFKYQRITEENIYFEIKSEVKMTKKKGQHVSKLMPNDLGTHLT